MQELRICTACDRRRGILIYRRFGTAPRRSTLSKFQVQQTKIADAAARAVSRSLYNSNIQYM